MQVHPKSTAANLIYRNPLRKKHLQSCLEARLLVARVL